MTGGWYATDSTRERRGGGDRGGVGVGEGGGDGPGDDGGGCRAYTPGTHARKEEE
jgi:hypothetical protein